jgi:hypothetical protein
MSWDSVPPRRALAIRTRSCDRQRAAAPKYLFCPLLTPHAWQKCGSSAEAKIGSALTRTFHSDAEAEQWIADFWIAIERHQLPTPDLHVRGGFGLTVTIDLPNSESAKLLADESHPAID